VTLIPALAERAEHVTMLQRSPSYVISLPAMDPLAGLLERVLPDGLSYRFTRWKNMRLGSRSTASAAAGRPRCAS
jgi:cation diffusion facilitator CzcD-associated flavoprotein CzcO